VNQKSKRKAFTLIELMVVVVIIGILSTSAVVSISSAIKFHKQVQAAEIISNAIRNVKSFALAHDVNTSNDIYYDPVSGYSTRQAFSLYFFQGWIDHNDSTKEIAQGDSADNTEFSYSILTVKDPGYNVRNMVKCPDNPGITGLTKTDTISGLSGISNTEIRDAIIRLPEGVVLAFSSTSDDASKSAGTLLGGAVGDKGMEYITYDATGVFVAKSADGGGAYNAFTSVNFTGKKPYIAVLYMSGGEIDETVTPIYLDLRTGDRVKDVFSNFTNITWPDIAN
jgi:prepilin-type N-terminal cleavage/methylation domain-containing protein